MVSSVPLSILALQGLHCARQAVVMLQYEHLTSVLGINKNIIEQWMSERRQDIRLLSRSSVVQNAVQKNSIQSSREDVLTLLRQIQDERPFFESIIVYDTSWEKIARTEKVSHDDKDLLDPKFRTQLREADDFVMNNPHLHEDNKIGLHMGFPFTNELGAKVGYIVYNLSLTETVQSIIAKPNIHSQDPYNNYLLSSDGVYICLWKGHEKYLGKRMSIREEMLTGFNETVVEYKNYLGEDVLGLSTQIPDTGWILVSEIRRNEAFEWIRVLGFRAILTGVITLLIIAYFSIRISGKISKPMRDLAETAREVASGNTALRVDPTASREAYDLANAFNHMLDKLNVMHTKLIQTASLAAVGELSASVVHEMRNPLATIKMNVRALQKRVDDDPDYSELGLLAFTQAERLERMLNDLLNYGKPISLQPTRLNLEDLFSEVTAAIQPRVDGKEIEINVNIDKRAESITADYEQMQGALVNLLDNAVDACDGNGLITISSRLDSERSRSVSITITDNGRGLPAKTEKEIFRPFYTTREHGTGLGLAIVTKIIDLHGGSIEARNRQGGGAEFTIKLPNSPDFQVFEQPNKIDQTNRTTGT